MTRRKQPPGLVRITMPDGTVHLGRDVRFITKPARRFLRHKPVDIAFIIDQDHNEHRLGPITSMEWL